MSRQCLGIKETFIKVAQHRRGASTVAAVRNAILVDSYGTFH